MKTICQSLFAVCLTVQALSAQANYKPVRSAEEVIRSWSEDQHLYVKGELGVGVDQLGQLESWLDANAPHWTVVLMNTARGEYYESPDGRELTGMDAVEHALGHGLSNRTGFGDLVNSKIGEQDGAIFVLFLQERKFSYFSSDAQDHRGLGESRWIGFLDRHAIRAMRGGGRIVDAVKDTISSINTSLDQAIERELADKERLARARAQAKVQAETDIELARAGVREVEESAAAVSQALPEATGELAAPPLDEWTEELDRLSEQLTEDNAVATSQDVEQLFARMEKYQLAYAELRALDENLAPLEKQAVQLLTAQEGIAQSEAEDAISLIKATKEQRDAGEIEFTDFAVDVKEKIAEAQTKVDDRQRELARIARRQRIIRRTLVTTLAIVGAVCCGFLIFLNRRRAPTKKEALVAFGEREQTVNAEMDRVLGLFDRANEVLGSKEHIADRGYVGTTKAKTDDAFSGVDALLIMSGEVRRVIDEARELVFPRGLLGKIANLFSAARYERAMNHISGEPLQFKRTDGLPLVLEQRHADEHSERSDVIGDGKLTEIPEAPKEVITRTFEQVFNAFHDRCDFTDETLDVIEHSLLNASDKLNELQAEIDQLTEIEKNLDEATEQDTFFEVPEFFDTLIPSAQRDLDVADDLGAEDPVRIMQEHIPTGMRKISEGKLLATTIARARYEIFPSFDDYAPRLVGFAYDTDWIQENIYELSEVANELFGRAAEESVSEEAHEFADDLTTLGDRVRESAEIATELHEQLDPSVNELLERLESARQTVGDKLSLPVERCLAEAEANPDDQLRIARQQSESAKAAIHLGSTLSATEATLALKEAVSEGRHLVDESLRVLRSFENELEARQHDHRVTAEKLPDYRQQLDQVREEYATTALLFRAGDPAYPDGTSSTESHWRECERLLSETEELLEQAKPIFEQARLLEADAKITLAEENVAQANVLMEEISQHCSRLEDQTRTNSDQMAELAGRLEAIDSDVEEHRTTRETMDDFARFSVAVKQTADRVGAWHRDRDPFDNAETLASHNERFHELESMIAADRDSFAEAGRAVKGAEAEQAKANRLVQQAERDGIPDSGKTRRCITNIAQLEKELKIVAAHLDVPHGNWQQVDGDAARINADLGQQSDALAGELRLAQESVDLFERASRDVFNATNWTGRYGIRVTGAPGAHELERARDALRSGDYQGLVQLARAAATEAQYAIQRAQRMVARRRREEQRREEERRRRRRRSSISIGSGGIGGGGRSRSISRPSSSGRSNSGFSRSGW